MAKFYKNIAFGLACAALGFAAALPIVVFGSDKSPEFYGAFAAAIIAAAALLLGSFYQDNLTRERDEKLLQQTRNAEAIDLCFWLRHCDGELEFIESALKRMRDNLKSQGKLSLEMPLERFRGIIAPHFHEELLEKAKIASKLTPEMAGLVAGDLYKTFIVADRIFLLRQATDDYQPSLEAIEKYVLVIGRRREVLRRDALLIEEFLVGKGALPRFPAIDED